MVTSRTGTTVYLRNRAKVLRQAKRDGLTHCPGYQQADGTHRQCGRELDYETPRTLASAETDHVVEVRHGGNDDASNLRVLCRTCNLDRNRDRPAVQTTSDATSFPLLRAW